MTSLPARSVNVSIKLMRLLHYILYVDKYNEIISEEIYTSLHVTP